MKLTLISKANGSRIVTLPKVRIFPVAHSPSLWNRGVAQYLWNGPTTLSRSCHAQRHTHISHLSLLSCLFCVCVCVCACCKYRSVLSVHTTKHKYQPPVSLLSYLFCVCVCVCVALCCAVFVN